MVESQRMRQKEHGGPKTREQEHDQNQQKEEENCSH